ncbi:MAG TPA: GGDEF domain-containing protein, partial [Pseudothermotoga sp.]
AERDKMAAVIYVDLNKFKFVNDRYGHHVGDQVLETIGRRIKSMVRKGDLVARLGGDEFVFFLSDSDRKIAEEVTKRIAERISCPIVIDGVQFCLGMSAGISIFPKDGETIEELIRNADKAMYKAKDMAIGYVFSSE